MDLLEKTINFQNRAEEEFQETKSLKNILKFMLALLIFFASTLFAAFTFPFRYIFNKIKGESKVGLRTGSDDNINVILKKERLVLVDFWAEWCGPCVMMNPALKEFSQNHSNVKVVKVNADLNMKTLKRFKVKGLPHFLLFKNGKEIKRCAGSMTTKGLQRFCFEE